MASLLEPFSPLQTSRTFSLFQPPYSSRKTHQTPPKPTRKPRGIHCSKFGNFLDVKPEQPNPEPLRFDLPPWQPSDRSPHELVVIGAGPAGLRLAEQVSGRGVRVCCIDPAPLSSWPNNYGVWVDELRSLSLDHCLDKTWQTTSVFLGSDEGKAKHLDRPYGRVDRRKLKTELIQSCLNNGVRFHKARAWEIEHFEFESVVSCDDGNRIRASLVVDASGFGSRFIEYDKARSHGYQIAHGILAEVESHPFDLDKMVLMDWRDSHLGNEPYLRANNSKCPTFLYAMPFDSRLVFLEETSLVSRPVLGYSEVKKRMAARLRHLGIRVKRVLEEEKCLIPMGGPLPRVPQSVVAIGGASGMVHPATGYMLARAMGLATALAGSIVEGLGSTRMIRGKPLRDRVWNTGLWPLERRCAREFYSFGMETLLRLDLDGTRRLFDAFFDLEPYYWHGFLSSRLTLGELALLGLSLFGRASGPSKVDIVTKCPVPLVRMVGNLALEAI